MNLTDLKQNRVAVVGFVTFENEVGNYTFFLSFLRSLELENCIQYSDKCFKELTTIPALI